MTLSAYNIQYYNLSKYNRRLKSKHCAVNKFKYHDYKLSCKNDKKGNLRSKKQLITNYCKLGMREINNDKYMHNNKMETDHVINGNICSLCDNYCDEQLFIGQHSYKYEAVRTDIYSPTVYKLNKRCKHVCVLCQMYYQSMGNVCKHCIASYDLCRNNHPSRFCTDYCQLQISCSNIKCAASIIPIVRTNAAKYSSAFSWEWIPGFHHYHLNDEYLSQFKIGYRPQTVTMGFQFKRKYVNISKIGGKYYRIFCRTCSNNSKKCQYKGCNNRELNNELCKNHHKCKFCDGVVDKNHNHNSYKLDDELVQSKIFDNLSSEMDVINKFDDGYYRICCDIKKYMKTCSFDGCDNKEIKSFCMNHHQCPVCYKMNFKNVTKRCNECKNMYCHDTCGIFMGMDSRAFHEKIYLCTNCIYEQKASQLLGEIHSNLGHNEYLKFMQIKKQNLFNSMKNVIDLRVCDDIAYVIFDYCVGDQIGRYILDIGVCLCCNPSVQPQNFGRLDLPLPPENSFLVIDYFKNEEHRLSIGLSIFDWYFPSSPKYYKLDDDAMKSLNNGSIHCQLPGVNKFSGKYFRIICKICTQTDDDDESMYSICEQVGCGNFDCIKSKYCLNHSKCKACSGYSNIPKCKTCSDLYCDNCRNSKSHKKIDLSVYQSIWSEWDYKMVHDDFVSNEELMDYSHDRCIKKKRTVKKSSRMRSKNKYKCKSFRKRDKDRKCNAKSRNRYNKQNYIQITKAYRVR